MATPQSQALTLANQILQNVQQMNLLYDSTRVLLEQWSDDGCQAVLTSLGTCAVNADGSLGAADATSVGSHPINTALYPALNRAISSADLLALQTYPLTGLKTLVEGGAVAAVPAMRQLMNKATGG